MFEPSESPAAWEHCLEVVRPALVLAPRNYLQNVQDRLAAEGIQMAVAQHDTPVIFGWIVRLLDRQGISNAAAIGFAERHGSASWLDVETALSGAPRCTKLQSYWHFHDCGYRKAVRTCSRPDLLQACPLPRLPARKGGLNQAAFSLALFVRDICNGDLVGWIDDRLAAADPGIGVAGRAAGMRTALLEPPTNIVGTGPKVWAMILAELLLGADPDREKWTTTGASFVAVDSLVHAYLHRTGCLRRLAVEHPYGPRCYAPGGCGEIIAALAERIDARDFNADFPAVFPRFIQSAIWLFCAADGWSVCNAIKIDDATGCCQRFCPCYAACERVPLHDQKR